MLDEYDGDLTGLELAAIALLELGQIEAVSGTLMHAGRTKSSYLLESPKGLFVVSGYVLDHATNVEERVQSIMSAMLWASQAGVSACPVTIDGRLTSRGLRHVWAAYEFIDGPTLIHSKPLDEIYACLGAIAATLHAVPAPGELQHQPALISRLEHPIVPCAVHDRLRTALSAIDRQRLLHGDLNASNIVLGHSMIAIDFDDCGIGTPELDLAISIGYVNTSPGDIRKCFESLVSGYMELSTDLDLQSLGILCGYIPWYLAASQFNGVPTEKIKALDLEQVRWQASAIQRALPEFGPW